MGKVEEYIKGLEEEIESWKHHDWMHSMSDDFWYTNGGHDNAMAKIRRLEQLIKEVYE